MTDNKKYIINVGDQAEEWTSDMYAQKGDSLFAKYKDAEVFEVEDTADFDEDPTDHQYIINVGDESEVWDGDMVKEKGAKLKEAYPDVKIQRVSYKDYWGEQATANREQRALLAQPDQERNAKLADLGYYDDITGEAFSYTQSEEGVPQWGPSLGLQPLSSIVGENEDGTTSYADPKVAEFFASDTSYTDRQAEIARLDAEYESNPSVIAQREYEAQWRADQAKYNDTLEAQIRKDAEADGVGDAQRRQNRKIAPMLGMGNPMLVAQYNAMYADAELPTKQSENYASALNMMEKIKELQKVSEKGFGGATLDVAKEKFESWREPDIALYNRVGDILTNLEAEFKDEGLTPENLTPEVLEQHLSNDEKALILAFFQYNSALEDAQQDMSAWYKGGKIFAESVPFMLEFLATGGLYKTAGSAATKGMAGALKKWVLGAAKGSVKRTLRKGAAVALRDLVYAGVGTLARTVVSPGTYNRMAEESVKIEDGHIDRTKNVFKSFADSYIENLSEISGGLIGKGLGLLSKGIGKAASMSGIPFSKLGSMLADNKLMQTIAAGWKSVAPKFEALGFHGLFEEIGEEYIGNAIREFTIQPGALAEMHKDDNFGAMLIGFAPMTLFGGAMSAVSIGAKNIEAANLGKKLRETLGQHYSEEQIDHMMNLVSGAENSKDVWEAIKPLTVGLNAEETQQLFQYGAFMAQNKAMLFAKKAQDDNLAQAKRAELQQTYNKFWQQNAEGAESVQIATLDDGRTVYVVSEPTADGVVSIIDAASGAKGFTNVSNYRTQEVDGTAAPMTQTWSMDAYLEAEIASERRTSEQARMQREYNEQVQNLQSQIQEGTKINLGTEGNPVIMLATGKFVKDGVIAVDQAGNTHTIGWNQVADAMKQPIRVKTDQQLIDEEMAAIVARNAERRKRMTDADPAMTDAVNESAAQSAEVVAQENRHIPMNEDGTVNEAAFWEQDPEGYVQWNDEQNQDGGADSLQQVAITKAVLTSLLTEAQQAQQTSNPAERKAAKQRAQEIAEKINRLKAIEAGYAERRIAPLRERAMKWKSLTNAPVYIIETEDELASISGQAAESNKGGARVRGFAKDGRAYIYLPGIVEESEIDAVFMHEAVAHTGLKGLLGQQAFDELCDQVWEMMSPEMQAVFINYPGVNGNTRAAADEYIAHLAETMGAGIAEAEEKTIWQSIIDFVRNILRSMGIALNVSESELSDLIHMAYADLAKNMAEAEGIAVQQQETRVAESEAPSAARQEYDTYAEDLTHDEIKAVAANDFNAAQEAYNALVGAAPKVEMGESAKDFIARKKAYNEQVAEAKAALDARQALMDEIARIDAANAPVLTDAEVLEQAGFGVDTQNDDVRMSVRYVPTEKQREIIVNSIMNVTGRSREEAERWLASETSLAAMINDDLQYLDYVADPKYKAIKDNLDYPQGTIDFNNICRKRTSFTKMFTRLQRRYPNKIFTAEELAEIRTIMSKDGLMVACGLCYVEDRRQMMGEVAQLFIDGLQDGFKTYASSPTKKKFAKKFNELVAGETYVPQIYELTTQEGLDKLYREHRNIWEAYQAYNNARGQQAQNLFQGYAEYKREILSWSDKKVKWVNDNGGMRIFSYSDFEAHHLIDVVQIIIDCAAKGVKIQGYTKVPEFARAMANTRIKLNRSLIPLGDTGLIDGRLAFDPVEGIDINDPNFLESNDNVGNILVGINDEQIRVAMADPRIHYIIPYHARQKENVRQKLNVGAWTNYISTQNERNISDGKRVKDNINIYTDILTGDVTTDRQFVEKYLQLCKEKGRIPKFDQFLEKDAEGNYLYTPGYYKFLVDFKLFDENGNILPQQPVVAEFDDAFNMQILENYAKDERESTGEQMNETYDKIVDALGLDESAAEGEDVRFSAKLSSEEKAQRRAEAKEIYSRVLKNEFNDVTLQLIDKYLQDAAGKHRISYRLPEEVERTLLEDQRTSQVDALISRISESTVPATDRSSQQGREEIEKKKKELLKNWAIASGVWYSDISEVAEIADLTPLDQGTDSIVYLSNIDGYLVKIKHGKPFGKRFRPDIDDLALYNHFFENTAYKIIGYGDFGYGISTIVMQPIVDFAEEPMVSVEDRVEYMREMGFEPMNKEKTAFTNGYVVASDIQRKNIVRDSNGDIRVIDADMKLHTRDLGGKHVVPPVESDTRLTVITPEMDADYLAAVERGDMETAQRMFLEAAKLAMPNTKIVDKKGNPAVVHHGTKGKFNTFAYSREDIGFHFGTKGTARTRIGRGKDARIMQVFLNLENPLIFDTDLGSWDADYIVKDLLKKEMMSYDDAKAILLTPNGYKRNSVPALVDLRQWMSNNGYDGIVYPNWYESDGKDSYIAFKRNQIKSADPITYDGAGNVIPLSERFNPENEDIRFSARTDEQREALFDKAKAQFGLTNNFKVAGYMLPDGSLLDFSEANDGGDPNQRTLDHREIEGIIMDEGTEYDSRWMYLADFMNEGAIRLLPEYAGINLMKAPTKEQRSRLFDFIYKYNGEVILEIADERLNNVAYVEYDRRTSPSRIFRDIDGYFNEGIVPQQDVRFSVFEPHDATVDEIDGLFREYNMDESLTPLYDKVSALAHSMDLKIRFDYPWSAAAGSTFGDKVKFNTEFFNSLAYKSQDKAHALLHEMIHATTNYAIAARNTGVLTEGMKEAVSQLEGIYGEIVNDSAFDGTYGARSVYEMVAELSNPEFRSLLKEKNLFQRIVDAIKRLLGIEVGENALDNLSATLDYMLDNYDGRVFGAVVNQYQKHQEYTRFSAVQIDPAVRQEMDTIKAKAMWDGTFMKAPNGTETKLTEEQWLMVRTKNFINWFGDWINDPANASKIVDENGEPMVVYHGTNEEFNVFGKSASRFGIRGNIFGDGYYFSSSKEVAEEYANRYLASIINGERIPVTTRRVIPAFLNIVDMIDIDGLANWKEEAHKQKIRIWNEKSKTPDGLVVRSIKDGSDTVADTYLVYSPSQIKSAVETTGEFSESDDIRYSSRFDVDPNPTEAQKKAGNYKMGHLRLDGYNITIENPKGAVRRGTDSKGNEWENMLNNDYGYIRGTKGVDGDHIDVYLSDNPEEGNVFVVDQVRPDTGEFDEHKVMYGFNSMDEAREAYLANFSEGWNGLGTITEVTKDEFRKWIDSSHRKTKPFSEYKSVKTDILDEGDIRYSVVTDPALLERLDSEPTIKVYRAMQLIDGKLYPPMSAKVDGKMREPIELGKWEQAEERPDLADEKGYFKLDKGNKTSLKARYNPYFHTSPTPLNDQFSSAQTRPELVTVEVEVPESELTSGYKADKAKDSVGQMEWKAGVVQSKLSGTRTVILSRWDKPIRIVPDSEVADKIVEKFDGKDITMPSNVVTPSLRAELESRGIPFVETDNNGKPVEADVRFSALPTQEEIQAVRGLVSLERMNISHEYEMTMVKDMIDAERNLIKMLQKRTQTPLVQQQIKNAEERLRRNLRQMEILQEVDDALIDTTPVQPDYQSKMADMSPITKEEYFAQLFTMHLTPITQTKVVAEDGTETTIRQGGKKNGIMLTPQTLMREMGWSKSDWKGLRYIVSESEGMALDAIAEMVSEDSEVAYLFSGMDTMEIKDAIIDFLQSMGTYAEIRDYVKNERIRLAEEEAGTINAEIEYAIEQLEAQYGMPIEQYNEMTAQAYREAREKWLDEAENPEGFAKFEESKIDEYGEETIDGREERPREESSEDVGRASDEAESFEDAEDGEDLPEGDGTDHPGGGRGPGAGGSSRGDDSRAEGADTEPGLVSTDVEASDRGVDELVEEGKQKAEKAGADFMDAITAINGKLSDLHRAAAAQREYDKATIQIVTSLANELLEKGKLSDLTRGEIKRLIATLKDSVGKKDLTITFDRLMNLLITNQLRLGRERFEEFLKIKASKVDARGVEVKGKLDIPGQRVIGALKEGIGLDVDTLAERISDCEDKLSSDSETVRRNAEIDLVGYKLALNYMVDIKASQIEEKNLRKSLADAKEDYDAGEMTKEAYKEFQKSVYNAIRENRMERVNAYEQILDKLAKIVKRSILGAEWMNDAEKQRVERIHHYANSDMQGMPAAEHERKESLFWNNPVTRFLLKPFATFDQMLRSFAPKSRNGEGYLWNHFMGGWLKATENEYKGIQAAHNILDAKAREVFGSAVKRWSDIFVLERSMPKAEVIFWDDGQFKTYEIPQGNLLYIYMVNKMSDGKMKLRRMGITEEDVDAIVANLSPEFIKIADWLQNDFLPGLREKYNAVHEKLFGAPMAAIDNYFPIKVNANSRTRDIDLGIGEMEGKPSTITGSIIKRTKNALALDILHSDAFDVVLGHIEEMEHWAAFAEWNQDLNSLLSYRKFRNRVQNTSGIYGAGTTAWNSFKATAEIAAGVYKPATRADSVDKTIMNIAKGVTGSKIAFRVYTAFKQLLSWPAFLADANWAILAKNFATPAKAWTWSMENLPLFEKRWKSRQAGDSRLMETDADWKIWKSKVVEIAGRLGMTPNAFIDALTVAIGSRSVYETKVKEYLKDGYTQEEAEEKAKRDATVSFNESQQSNESAFLSQVQLDRTVASVVFTVFRNSSMGYQRQYVDAIRNMVHMLKPNYREQSVEYMRKQMVRDGLSEEQAERAANRIYNRSFTRNALKALTFGFVVQFAWNLGPSLVYMLLGDDDEEKRAAAKDAAVRALVGGPVEGMASGNVISNVLGNIAMGEDLSTVSGVQLPAVSDLENVVTLWENDKVRATNEVFNLLISSGLGFSPQTITDAVVSIIDAAGGDLKVSTEITLALLRILQVPQSQTEKLFMDEIDMTADDAYDMTVEEFAQRYARYRMNRSAGPFVPFYSDEDERKREEQYIKMFTQKADEARRTRGSEVAQKFFEYYDNGYEEVRKTIGEMQREIKDFSINELIDDAEQTEARLQEFMKTEEFEKYAELTPYIKMYEGYKGLLKKIDNPDTRMEYAREMAKAMTEMVKIMEDME